MDAIIIGGGIIGLSIARELHKAGMRKIAVLEKGKYGREASWAAAGMLAPDIEAEQNNAFRRFCLDSNDLYPEFVRELETETGISIDHKTCGTIEPVFTDADAEDLSQKFSRLNAEGVRADWLTGKDVSRFEPGISRDVTAGIHYPNNGYVDNRDVASALVEYAKRNGIELHEDNSVDSLLIEGSVVSGVEASGRELRSENTIIATGAWSSLIKFGVRKAPFSVRPIKGQMAAFSDASLDLKKVLVAPGAYLTPRSDGRILVGATVEDVGFDRAVDASAVEDLCRAARRAYPALQSLEPIDTWCGFRPFTEGGLPMIGKVNGFEGLGIATAHFRNGILLAPLTAKIIADLVANGNISPYLECFGVKEHLVNVDSVSR